MKTRRCAWCNAKCPAEEAVIGQLKAFCSYEHLREYAKSDKGSQRIEKAKKAEQREKDRKTRAKLKTRSDWLKEAQVAFNAYVRYRDRHQGCISCSKYVDGDVHGTKWDAGHYRSTGSAPHLRFHLHNCHKQCVKCNRYLSGNVANYRVGLIWKLGHEKVEALEIMNDERRYDIEYLARIKNVFKKKLRMRQKNK